MEVRELGGGGFKFKLDGHKKTQKILRKHDGCEGANEVDACRKDILQLEGTASTKALCLELHK